MNRRKHANIVPVAALVRWVVIALFLAIAGLGYVNYKNQLQTTGTDISNLEAQFNALTIQDEIERAQIAQLTSHGYLERRLAEGFIKLTPIRDNCIQRLHFGADRTASADPAGLNDIQPVANRLTAQ